MEPAHAGCYSLNSSERQLAVSWQSGMAQWSNEIILSGLTSAATSVTLEPTLPKAEMRKPETWNETNNQKRTARRSVATTDEPAHAGGYAVVANFCSLILFS